MRFDDLRFLAVKVTNKEEEKAVLTKMLTLKNEEMEEAQTLEEINEIVTGLDTGEGEEKFIVAMIETKELFGIPMGTVFKLGAASDIPKDSGRLAITADEFLNEKELNGEFIYEDVTFKVTGKKVTAKHNEMKFKALALCSNDDKFSITTAVEIIGIKFQIKNYRRMLKNY